MIPPRRCVNLSVRRIRRAGKSQVYMRLIRGP
jgi:hypothetical protein